VHPLMSIVLKLLMFLCLFAYFFSYFLSIFRLIDCREYAKVCNYINIFFKPKLI
jgi:hypothetical protein